MSYTPLRIVLPEPKKIPKNPFSQQDKSVDGALEHDLPRQLSA